MQITIRSYKDDDYGCVLDYTMHSIKDHLPTKLSYIKTFLKSYLPNLINNSNILLAVSPEADWQIFSFIIYTNNPLTIHLIATKQPYKHFGIATTLLNSLSPTYPLKCSNLPRLEDGSPNYTAINKFNLDYNPTLFWELFIKKEI